MVSRVSDLCDEQRVKRLDVSVCTRVRLSLVLLILLVVASCYTSSPYYEDSYRVSQSVVVTARYECFEPTCSEIETTPFETTVFVEGGRNVFRRGKTNPYRVFSDCGRVFVEVRSNYGSFLSILCKDGTLLPVWDWTDRFEVAMFESFSCKFEDRNKMADILTLRLELFDLSSLEVFSEERTIYISENFDSCEPWDYLRDER